VNVVATVGDVQTIRTRDRISVCDTGTGRLTGK
jgi:hypothetical protein